MYICILNFAIKLEQMTKTSWYSISQNNVLNENIESNWSSWEAPKITNNKAPKTKPPNITLKAPTEEPENEIRWRISRCGQWTLQTTF